MTQSTFSLNFKDDEGRRPYLPHDHRHTGHRPSRKSVASIMRNYTPSKNETHDEVVDRIAEIGARFGLDVHIVPILRAHLNMPHVGAALAKSIDKMRALDIENLTSKQKADLEEIKGRQIGYLSASLSAIDQIEYLTESMALTHHIRWIIESPETRTFQGLTKALARSRLSLEDLSGTNRIKLDQKIADMERIISMH